MKLASVEVTNFRCFETAALKLNPDVNVLVGANGAGKTALLDALALALYKVVVAALGGGGKRERSEQQAALRPTDIRVEPGVTDPVLGRKDFVHFRATATGFYPVEGFPATTPDRAPAAIDWDEHVRFRPPEGFSYDTKRDESRTALNRYFLAIWQEIRKSAPDAMIPLPVVAYYRAHRRLRGMPDLGNVFALDLSREEAFAHALDAGADFQAMCQWFYLRENAELRARASDGKSDDLQFTDLRAIREALSGAIEGVERVFFDGNPPRLKIAVRAGDGMGEHLELGQLSDGYRALLALVLDFARRLAQAHPNWPKPLEAPGILLVDEIELHLHPRWQQTVIPDLRRVFPNTQLVVTTHSPAILTTVRREHVHLLGSNHALDVLPASVGTFGAESSRVLAEVFGTDPRPPSVDTVAKLRRYFELVEARGQDTDEGRAMREELLTALGASDPDLRRADMRVSQIKALGKQ